MNAELSRYGEAKRKVAATTQTTIHKMPQDIAKKIEAALNEPFDPLSQDHYENRALSKVIQQESRGVLRIDVHMLRIVRSIAYRAIREETRAAQRLGCPHVTTEVLKDARLYMAGFLAGQDSAWKAMRRRGLDMKEGQPADALDPPKDGALSVRA